MMISNLFIISRFLVLNNTKDSLKYIGDGFGAEGMGW